MATANLPPELKAILAKRSAVQLSVAGPNAEFADRRKFSSGIG
jgi:hypothetical protein